MREIIFIFCQIFLILIFFVGPLNFKTLKIFTNYNLNFFDSLIYNTVLNSTLLLILSFFVFEPIFIFYLIVFINILTLFYSFDEFKKYFKFENNLKIFIFFIICFISISFLLAYDPKMTWDGIAHWYWKAMNFNQNGNYENLKNMPMSYYPHLGSYIWSFFWSISPSNYEYLGRMFYIFVFLIPFFSASHRILEFKNEFSTILTLILIVFTFDKFLIGGYQEYLLFFLFYSFSLIIFLNKDSKSMFLLLFAFMSTVLMMWVKQEGLFYSIILLILFIIFFKTSKLNKVIYSLLALFSIYTMFELRIFYHGEYKLNESFFHPDLLRYFDLKIFSETFYLISYEIVKGIIKYPIWLVILLIIIYNLFREKKLLVVNNVFIIIYFSLIYAIYFQTKIDINWLMPLTLDRVLLHGSGFYLIYIFTNTQKIIYDS